MLIPDKTRTEHGLRIHEKIIPDSAVSKKYLASWCQTGWKMKPCRKLAGGRVQGITVHNTPDLMNVYDDAEQYTRATWPNCNMGGVVVHYYVDDTGAWQNLREEEQGWHATDGSGPGNTTTLAVEIIMDDSGSKEDKGSEENGALLCAVLLHRHGLGIDKLYTHNHWMGQADKIVAGARKNCPLYILPHWAAFKAKVQSYLTAIQKGESGMKGIRYIGNFSDITDAANLRYVLNRGGNQAEVINNNGGWGVLVTKVRKDTTQADFIDALNKLTGFYNRDPASVR